MQKILIAAVALTLTGCATINTPVGQVVLPVEPIVVPVMRAPNAAWNCYVNIPQCLTAKSKKK